VLLDSFPAEKQGTAMALFDVAAIKTIRAWLGHVSQVTTNVYAEVDLEMKAKALARCEMEREDEAQKPWREDEGLMDVLRTL
jgi:hypothetical protein